MIMPTWFKDIAVVRRLLFWRWGDGSEGNVVAFARSLVVVSLPALIFCDELQS